MLSRNHHLPFQSKMYFAIIFIAMGISSLSQAGEWPKELHAYRGSTPNLDGVVSEEEYSDATEFHGVEEWNSQFSPVNDPTDLSLRGWVKHDGQNLYFAFQITDDVLYGIETDRWLPDENPNAHEFSPQGYPWFGDGLELLINARYEWSQRDGQTNHGDGRSWQMVCNLTKSVLGGIGIGGLMQGEQRNEPQTWANYTRWIEERAQQAVAKPLDNQNGYIVEWMIQPDPCLEVNPGKYWSPEMGITKMGLNIGVQDLDEREKGEGNFGNFHHEEWWAGEKNKRTWLKQWGTLILHPDAKPNSSNVQKVKSNSMR